MSKTSGCDEAVGRVIFLSEALTEARELSSCCVGVEARLEATATQTGRRVSKKESFEKSAFRRKFKPLIKSG